MSLPLYKSMRVKGTRAALLALSVISTFISVAYAQEGPKVPKVPKSELIISGIHDFGTETRVMGIPKIYKQDFQAAKSIVRERFDARTELLLSQLTVDITLINQVRGVLNEGFEAKYELLEYLINNNINNIGQWAKLSIKEPLASLRRRASPKNIHSRLQKLLGNQGYPRYLALADSDVESPGSLDDVGPYFHIYGTKRITEDFELEGSGFGRLIIDGNDIDVNCNGYNLIGLFNPFSAAITINGRSNVRLYNCGLFGFNVGVNISHSSTVEIWEIRSVSNNMGFVVEDSTDVTLHDNKVSLSSSEGFSIRDSVNTLFFSNESFENRDGFDENRGSNSFYGLNVARDNVLNGFEIDFGSDPIYASNESISNGQNGISLDAVFAPLVKHNVITDNGRDGLRLDDERSIGTTNGIVLENVSERNGRHSAHQCNIDLCKGNDFKNNTFVGSTNNI